MGSAPVPLGPNYDIPDQYSHLLEYVQDVDERSDQQILQQLCQHVPVRSEKNIWAFWDSGVLKMPQWAQRNVIDWVRICGPDWDIRILDNVPESCNYALKYLGAELFPDSFVNRSMHGAWVGQHSGDFVRGASLYTYGGVSLDVGIILSRHMDRICWDKLEDPETPYRVATSLMVNQVIGNHIVAARKGDPFIKRWHDLIIHIWKDKEVSTGMMNHPLLAFARHEDFELLKDAGLTWDWKVPPILGMEYIWQVIAWVRLTHLEEPNGGFNGNKYWSENVYVFDAVSEDWAGEMMLGFAGSGQKLLDLLSLPIDTSEGEPEQQKLAHEVVWTILSKACMQKVSRAKNLTHSPHLGTLWDMPEHAGKDRAPGTFAELLRYGTVHFRQKRKRIASVVAVPAPPEGIIRKGLLEP